MIRSPPQQAGGFLILANSMENAMPTKRKSYGPIDWEPGFVDGLRHEKENNNHSEVTSEVVKAWENRLEEYAEEVGKKFRILLNDEPKAPL